MRWLVRILGIVGVVVAIVVVFLAGGVVYGLIKAQNIGALYTKRSQSDLTAAGCLAKRDCDLSKDAPIGALAEYRRCAGPVSYRRVKGEPLGCSQMGITDIFMRDWFAEGQTTYRQLRRGCRQHDLCYRHGSATFGNTRDQCDGEFLAENLRECGLIYDEQHPWGRGGCRARASLAYIAVALGGRQHFRADKKDEESILCEYEPGPHAVRDQVVAGRFLGGERDYVMTLAQARDKNALVLRLLTFSNESGQSEELAAVKSLSPNDVRVLDFGFACQRRRTANGGFIEKCPDYLGQTQFQQAAQWLRFAPIVVDGDGDGRDEIIIPSLTRDFGLVFTQIRVSQTGSKTAFEPVYAFLAVDRISAAEPKGGGCEDALEFSDCNGEQHGPRLSSESATQDSGYKFTVLESPDESCVPEGRPRRQEIVLLSASEAGPDAGGHTVKPYVMRRFLFGRRTLRWQMIRDSFTTDNHRVAGCRYEDSQDEFQSHSRLQYPPFAVRMPADKKGCVEERLGAVSRDKCPTTSPVARAGSLDDIDFILYDFDPKYRYVSDAEKAKSWSKNKGYDDLKMAKAAWLPLLWTETAHPLLTSRAARKNDIMLVGTFIGGTKWIGHDKDAKDPLREGTRPVIAVVRGEQIASTKPDWQSRHADTLGRAPDIYGLAKSSAPTDLTNYARATSESQHNVWDAHRYGIARIYLQLPSVLAPFTVNGKPGVSLVFFSNSSIWRSEKVDPAPEHPSQVRFAIRDGTFRLMIVPIPVTEEDRKVLPAMLDCPVSAIKDGAAAPAALTGGDGSFLQRQIVLAGDFFEGDNGGSLAIAWRDRLGVIRLTAVHYDGEFWKFGDKACRRPDGMKVDELYREALN